MKLFVKFQERKYLLRTYNDSLFYFGTAKKYKTIETEQHIKGQGDNREATFAFSGIEKGKMIHYQTGKVTDIPKGTNLDAVIDKAAQIPVYCITLIDTDTDCIQTEKGKVIDPKIMAVIRDHFPKADSALVFWNCALVKKQFEAELPSVKMGEVSYPWRPDDKLSIEYIRQIVTPVSEREYNGNIRGLIMKTVFTDNNGTSTYCVITEDTAYKILFCKHPYFSEEREYRFALPTVRLNEDGREYLIRGIDKRNKSLFSLEEFETLDFSNNPRK